MVRALIADDSLFMRRAISRMLASSQEIEIAGFAANGKEALEKTIELKPDVVTMDVEMPVMDGIEALGKIMEICPTPVVMISTMTKRGAEVTLKALSMGAVDFVEKPSSYSSELEEQRKAIIYKVLNAARANVRVKRTEGNIYIPPKTVRPGFKAEAVIIGVSTGGPKTLHEIVPKLPSNLGVPVFIVQHMPALFTGNFAAELDRVSNIKVKEARDGEPVMPNTVYIAPGGRQMEIFRTLTAKIAVKVTDGPEDALYKPCVDITAFSVAETYKAGTLGVMLTGMGNDGARAFGYIKKCGGINIVEAESTAVIFGMPKVVLDSGNADFVLPSFKIAEKIKELAYA
ncbi:protein-glutamate methylesterase/protein-glutamine glutaminase [Petroclostridium xylanilyticum]|uniref:protein-glutamate methylesterase/protein-glutamine glutaminase n=1 Tax=Petroclostridium xylanilyticum TaxID=1792311 RepID=UPI000B98CD69|nr:chemotaxis response regulator protein-glutamate methylesterase [Petroclostridium xylanilyticum]